jgi:hypothetical protein
MSGTASNVPGTKRTVPSILLDALEPLRRRDANLDCASLDTRTPVVVRRRAT